MIERSVIISFSDETFPYVEELSVELESQDPSVIINYLLKTLKAIELVTGRDPLEFAEDLASGDLVIVPVVKKEVCPGCHGARWLPVGDDNTKQCDTCGGSGKISVKP